MDLFRFIDWVLALPARLEDWWWTGIEQFDEANRMHYMGNFERKAQQKRLAEGIQKGSSKGWARDKPGC